MEKAMTFDECYDILARELTGRDEVCNIGAFFINGITVFMLAECPPAEALQKGFILASTAKIEKVSGVLAFVSRGGRIKSYYSTTAAVRELALATETKVVKLAA